MPKRKLTQPEQFKAAQRRVARYDELIAAWERLTAEDLDDLGWDGEELQKDIADLTAWRGSLAAAWAVVGQRRIKEPKRTA